MKEKKKRLNEEIQANIVQVITDDGENLGEMPLTQALEKARSLELDLMEMGQKGEILIVKLLDYGKYLYKQKKQEQKQKQQGKTPDIKNIRLTFKIGEHDLEVKRKQAEKFAQDGNPLKITLMLRGRENHYADIAEKKIQAFVSRLEDIYKIEAPVKLLGNVFHASLKPKK